MALLVRLAVMVGIGGLVLYLYMRLTQLASRRRRAEPQEMPICHKCESNRQVVVNQGMNPGYSREECHWYCQSCQEGF